MQRPTTMKLRTIIGIAAIGFAYFHFKRGGQLSLDSMRTTARDLFSRVKMQTVETAERAQKKVVHEVAKTVAAATETPAR